MNPTTNRLLLPALVAGRRACAGWIGQGRFDGAGGGIGGINQGIRSFTFHASGEVPWSTQATTQGRRSEMGFGVAGDSGADPGLARVMRVTARGSSP